MNGFLLRMVATLVLLICVSTNPLVNNCLGQSTVIQMPPAQIFPSNRQTNTSLPVSNHGSSADIERWERILDGRYPELTEDSLLFEDLIPKLRKLGLPVILTTSARDDSAMEEDPVTLPVRELPLRVRLLAGLRERNAGITMNGGVIRIISLDDVFDDEFRMIKTYDVSNLGLNPDILIDHITRTISTEDWEENGGLGTLSPLVVGGKDLLTINQTYRTHRQVQSLLTKTFQLAGSSRSLSTSSRVVSLSRTNPNRNNPTNQSTNRGGLFSVPSQRK